MKKKSAQTLGDVLTDFFADNPDLRRRIMVIRAQRAWGEVLGIGIMRYTRNVYIRDGVMHVSLTSAALRNELSLGRDKLLRSINDYVGEDVITSIIIR
jgi:hypothetical protein